MLCGVAGLALAAPASDRQWLAGDTHIHSHWSTGSDYRSSPPIPIKGRDALYSTPRNAVMARRFGLRWMVMTDHGGPNHSKVNLEQAYRELTLSRELVPEVLQFYGMELNMPGMDHHTLIVPRAEDEASVLYEIEGRFDANEDWARPPDPRRQSAGLRRRALEHMQALDRLPILFANHPSGRRAGLGVTVATSPGSSGRTTTSRRTCTAGWRARPATRPRPSRGTTAAGTAAPTRPRGRRPWAASTR